MYVMFEIQTYPQVENREHMVNLVFTESEKGTGKYTMTFRHNAYGDTLSAESEEGKQWGLTGAYVCFQISDIIQENKAEITLKWKEHVISGYNWLAETHERTVSISYSKDYFEQAPLNLKSKTSTLK